MIQKIKSYLLPLVMALSMAVPALVPLASASATDGNGCGNGIANKVAEGAGSAAGSSISCDSTHVGNSDIEKLAKGVVNIFSIIVGAVAIIMLIYGGFRYITSGGDSGRVGNAKNTLLYAIIGLVIVALAQIIVQFVLNKSSSISAGSGLGSQ
jgi:hypothetical protein